MTDLVEIKYELLCFDVQQDLLEERDRVSVGTLIFGRIVVVIVHDDTIWNGCERSTGTPPPW